ncbi:DUF6966 domain-containing protein [Vibrio nigripulchritudo]|uniref:DUF6966 domain-containing protein n=1 Tax=Vibrio nigripulchritudo TaxID=28173 RepID=UPI0007E51ED4
MYLESLNEMIDLLDKGDHEHWRNWFQLARKYYIDGNQENSFEKVLSAYGGMGSFNDVYWNLPKNDFERLEFLKGEIWKYSKSNL